MWLGRLLTFTGTLLTTVCVYSLNVKSATPVDRPRPGYWILGLINRAHSFPRPAEFHAELRNLGFFSVELIRRILPWNSSFCRRMLRNLTFFIRTTIFSQKITQNSSVTNLFIMIFF